MKLLIEDDNSRMKMRNIVWQQAKSISSLKKMQEDLSSIYLDALA